MNLGVEAQRQMQNVFEIAAHRGEASAMREPVGEETDEDRADDRE